MRYKYKEYELLMEGSEGTFYSNNKLIFKGFSYTAMKQFILVCDDPKVTSWFAPQLELREKPRFTPAEKQADDS